MTSRKAAEILGVSLTTVQHWVENGALRAWKTAGGHRRIARNSVEEMLKQQRSAIEKDQDFTVVVVEDEAVQLELYKMKFQEWDLPVKLITASNGFDGLLEIGRHRPNLIITDLEMPGMDGFEMIRTIINNKMIGNAQLVVVTGLSDTEIADTGGLPDDIPVLKKPIPFARLQAILGERLGF